MNNEVLIRVSGRHIHLDQKTADILFGEGYEFKKRDETISSVGYSVEERLKLIGPKGSIDRVGLLFPMRKETQVEISLTDARVLGMEVPVRLSGDIDGTPGIKLVGPAGEIMLERGVIVAKRHIHVVTDWAEKRGIKHDGCIKLKVNSEQRSLIFDDVVVRVDKNPDMPLVVHIDTDEANAAQIGTEIIGTVII